MDEEDDQHTNYDDEEDASGEESQHADFIRGSLQVMFSDSAAARFSVIYSRFYSAAQFDVRKSIDKSRPIYPLDKLPEATAASL